VIRLETDKDVGQVCPLLLLDQPPDYSHALTLAGLGLGQTAEVAQHQAVIVECFGEVFGQPALLLHLDQPPVDGHAFALAGLGLG